MTKQRLEYALVEASKALAEAFRPGTADSDINVLSLPCEIPRDALLILIEVAEEKAGEP